MTKTEILKKIKAGLLAGTMAASLSACGPEPAQKEEKTNSTTISTEDTKEETKTTNVENITEDTKENKTEEKTENNAEIVENIITEETDEPTTKNDDNTNIVTTQNHSSYTTKNNTTTPVGTQRTQTPVTTKANAKTTQKVTTKATTTTTKAVQTQAPVTQAPVTTTTPIKQNYNKYDLLDSNPEVAAKAFKQLSDTLREELFNGYYVSDESYGMTAGYEQAKIILAALNYSNGGISPKALANNDALGNLSREDMERYCVNLDLPQEQYLYGSRVDFNKYVIDDDFADEIERVTDIYFDWKDNGNSQVLDSQIKNYFASKNYKSLENVNNFAEFYYMCTIVDEYEYCSIDEDREMLREHLIIPMYESYEQYKEQSYSR